MVSTNKRAMKVVEEILANAEDLGCKVIKMDCGATIIDMGLECKGSWSAGVLFARACIGDLGERVHRPAPGGLPGLPDCRLEAGRG